MEIVIVSLFFIFVISKRRLFVTVTDGFHLICSGEGLSVHITDKRHAS